MDPDNSIISESSSGLSSGKMDMDMSEYGYLYYFGTHGHFIVHASVLVMFCSVLLYAGKVTAEHCH